MACCIVAATYVRYENAWDQFHEDPERISRVLWTTPSEGIVSTITSGPLAGTLKERFPEVEESTRVWSLPVWVRTGDVTSWNKICVTDPSFFDMFTFPLLRGDVGEPFAHSIVVTESAAKKWFGEENPIGKTIIVETRHLGGDYVITGILKDVPHQSSPPLDFDFLTSARIGTESIKTELSRKEVDWVWNKWQETKEGGGRGVQTFVRLRTKKDQTQLTEKLTDFIRDQFGDAVSKKSAYRLQPLEEIHLYGQSKYGPQASGNNIDALYLISGIAILILTVAVINYINLSTAQATIRSKEIAIRKTVGARRLQLFIQFTSESTVLAFSAMLLGIALAQLGLPVFQKYSGTTHSLELSVLEIAYPILLPLVAIVSLLAGAYPAAVLSSFNPAEVLKSKTRITMGRGGLRQFLVLGQFAACVILVSGTLVMHEQTQFLQKKSLGFDRDLIVTMPLFDLDRGRKPDWSQHLSYQYRNIKARIVRHPNIEKASAYRWPPGTWGGTLRVLEADGKRITMRVLDADEDYLGLFDIPLVKGRNFDRDAPINQISSLRRGWSFLLNESAVRQLGWEDPIGKTFHWRDGAFSRDGSVVGVIKDFNAGSLRENVAPIAIFYSANMFSHLGVKIKPNNIPESIIFLKETWESLIPERPFQYTFLDEQIAHMYRNEEQLSAMVGAFSILAMLLGCMGLFGLASFTVARRRKEIGIRKVLGDTTLGIVRRLAIQSVSVVVWANILAWPVGFYFLNQWLEQFAYRIEPSIWHFVIGGISAFIIAVLTVSLQAIRAAKTNPAEILLDE